MLNPETAALHRLSRRGLIRRGLWGSAFLALGGAGFLALQPTSPASVPATLVSLSPREYAVLRAIAARLVPGGGAFPGQNRVDVALRVDGILPQVHPQTVRELKLLLGLFENGLGNLLLGGRPRPFTAMVAEEQDRVLGEWRDSRLTFRRSGYQGLRGLVTATYYAAPETWAAVGYPGPPGRGAR